MGIDDFLIQLVKYWSCKKHFHDEVVGVSGSANYSDEFYDKQKFVRYDGRCSLNNSGSGAKNLGILQNQ